MVQATVISAVEVQDPFKKKKTSHNGGEGTRLQLKPQKWDRDPSS